MKGVYNNQGRKSGGNRRFKIYAPAVMTREDMWSMDELIDDIQHHGYNEEEALEMIRFMLSNHSLEKLPNGLYKKL